MSALLGHIGFARSSSHTGQRDKQRFAAASAAGADEVSIIRIWLRDIAPREQATVVASED
jgi:hypothetical protein